MFKRKTEIMKNILVLAYCVSPTRGSEYAVAWNYITKMSKYNRLTVLYNTSGDHMDDTTEIEEFCTRSPLQNVHFIPVYCTKTTITLNYLNRHNILPYTFYLAFKNWQKEAYKTAKQVVSEETFDLVHFLGPIGYREPGYLWKLDLPYIWGPIAGMNNYPVKLLKATYSFKGKLFFLIRTLINNIQLRTSYRVKQALKKSNVLLTATTENQKRLLKVHHVQSIWLPENGINGVIQRNSNLKFNDEIIHLAWIGRIDDYKAIIILIDALTNISRNNLLLHVIGDGPIKKEMEQYAMNKGVDHMIKWHGKVTRSEVFPILAQTHLHIITSLGEGNPTVIWEAMSLGIPTMTLDHCGMHDIVCEKCGFKIPIISYSQVINDITTRLNEIIQNPQILRDLSDGVIKCAQNYHWDNREAFWNDIYDLAIKNYQDGITSTSPLNS